jgi:aryl-alcohol dehydrogenase-like predicted oxidoreductase
MKVLGCGVGRDVSVVVGVVQPVSAIQMEWSLQSREIEDTLLPVARELGVAVVAYSPLGRGFLSARVSSIDDLDAGDRRRYATYC